MDTTNNHPVSSPPLLPYAQTRSRQSSRASPETVFTCDIFTSDVSPSRQQRRLRTRNARFPAKKLSISGLSNKLSQLAGKNEQISETDCPARNQENKLRHSKSTGTIGQRNSLRILGEISNTTRSRSSRRPPDIPVYQDHPERPLLQSSPFADSSPYVDPTADFTSPIAFDHIQDSLNGMRLTVVSRSERWSPLVKSPPSSKANTRKRSVPTQFDAEEYIEHIEKELQQVRDEAYSPLTRQPMKHKLRAATRENERLLKELSQLKEKFETDVKRTVEHKTVAEVELKRRVRDLEESLEAKDNTIRELQYRHEERRLDVNIIDSLKASIERLQQDKTDMEEINLSMSKRNEVLTQLLAMSPTKTLSGFNLGSPTKEKRNPRPLSLILPRLPTSPTARQITHPRSLAGSPRPINSAEISPLKLSPDDGFRDKFTSMPRNYDSPPKHQDTEPEYRSLQSPSLQPVSRRYTMYSDISAASTQSNDEPKAVPKRKARRFVAGSTQLKPLLLPTMTGETMSMRSASTASSPLSWSFNPYFETDTEDTVLANERPEELSGHSPVLQDNSNAALIVSPVAGVSQFDGCYAVDDIDAPENQAQVYEVDNGGLSSSYYRDVPLPKTSLVDLLEVHDDANEAQFGANRAKSGVACYQKGTSSRASLQTMPMPSTPESLAVLPRPLFSPAHRDVIPIVNDARDRPLSASPSASSHDQINMRKRRQSAFNVSSHGSPAPKTSKRRRRHSSVHELPYALASQVFEVTADSSSGKLEAPTKLRHVRSCDNFVEVLRQKNFAAKPLAAMTIKTVFKILATCTSAVREFRRDPFALARRVLANAWYMNWKMLGKVSWWVLGLFVNPQAAPKARPAIDWDQYDGESIARRYCGSQASDEYSKDFPIMQPIDAQLTPALHHAGNDCAAQQYHSMPDMPTQQTKPGWGRSLLLWGKFSAAMMLAVGGAVIQGPGEMLKDVPMDGSIPSSKHKSCKSCGHRATGQQHAQSTPITDMRRGRGNGRHALRAAPAGETTDATFTSDFNSQNESELDSSSFIDQIQQPSYDSTLKPEYRGRGQLDSLFSPTPAFEGHGLGLYGDDDDSDNTRLLLQQSQQIHTPGYAYG